MRLGGDTVVEVRVHTDSNGLRKSTCRGSVAGLDVTGRPGGGRGERSGGGFMSLGVAFKGPEGIVLAADSRVTLNAQIQIPQSAQVPHGPTSVILPATFDNATKLLRVESQNFVGAITYGAGAIGQQEPRTAHSFLPEFEATLEPKKRLTVEEFAKKLSKFFLDRWVGAHMPVPVMPGGDMVFLVGGYDKDAPYGTIFEFSIPSKPDPVEAVAPGQFGARWGGQHQIVNRLINGFDPMTPKTARDFLGVAAPALTPGQFDPLEVELRTKVSSKIPWQFLPLQDLVDLAIFVVRATITLQKWIVDIRGVGGAIDVATITRIEGFKYIQQKQIIGEAG